MTTSAEPDGASSLLSKYATKGALVYYALVLPAMIAEVIFSATVASTPDLVTQASSIGSVVAVVVPLLPWAILAISVYAIASFRPSLLVLLLIVSFFLAASVASGIAFLGVQLDLGATVIMVMAATFLALVGFNYARGLKLLGRRRPDIISSGPFGYNALGIALESAAPIAIAIVLVVIVQAAVAELGVQASLLPQPLSTLSSLYLQTRIGLVFTTLLLAGAAIWVLRQFIEPLILHFTLSAEDARKELLAEIQPTTRSVKKVARYRPSRGLAWGALTIACCAVLVAAVAAFLPAGQFSRDLLAALNIQAPSPSPAERLAQGSIQNWIVRTNILFAQSQDYIRTIIRLLWG